VCIIAVDKLNNGTEGFFYGLLSRKIQGAGESGRFWILTAACILVVAVSTRQLFLDAFINPDS
jgi:hypothetical protein